MSETTLPAHGPEPGRSSLLKRLLWRLFKLILVLLVVMFIVAFIAPILVEVPVYLLFGWVLFLWKTMPLMQVNVAMAASGLTALALAMWGLHRFASWLTSRISSSRASWKWRSTLAVTLFIPALFASAIAVVGVTHQIGWLSGQNNWFNDSWKWPNIYQESSVHGLEPALRRWAREHDDRYPDHLEAVLNVGNNPDYRRHLSVRLLASTIEETPEPWIYLASDLSLDAPDWLPLLTAPRPVTPYGLRLALLKNGQHVWLAKTEYQALMDRRREYLASQKAP